MNIDLINSFIKYIGINLGLYLSYCKIINNKEITIIKKCFILVISVLLALIESMFMPNISSIIKIVLSYIIFSFIMCNYCKIYLNKSMIITALSLCFSYISYFASSFLASILLMFLKNIDYKLPIIGILLVIQQLSFIVLFFKIKRFKSGIPYIKAITTKSFKYSTFSSVIILNIILLFLYFGMQQPSNYSLKYFSISFVLFLIVFLVLITEAFLVYHKQKLQLQALKDYEQELSETKQKLETAMHEKEKIVKSNHEFYHRQEALNKKLDNLLKEKSLSMNTEFSSEYSDILDRLNTLSDEYKSKTTSLPLLDKSGIFEIDDMLIYMQSECVKNNIDFSVKINCDLNYIITNYITKSQFETLIGDLIHNSIIAINHSSNNFKSIMVVFGIKDDAYELCILDSGIPFEINTLLNLGLQPASTHLDDGGTGIGFITTFETINSCKASLIINEITHNNYTKSLEIKFDNKNEYVIISERCDSIREMNKLNRNIVLKI